MTRNRGSSVDLPWISTASIAPQEFRLIKINPVLGLVALTLQWIVLKLHVFPMTLAWTLIVYHNYHVEDGSYEIHRGDSLLTIMLYTINMLICQVPDVGNCLWGAIG